MPKPENKTITSSTSSRESHSNASGSHLETTEHSENVSADEPIHRDDEVDKVGINEKLDDNENSILDEMNVSEYTLKVVIQE